MQWARFGPHNGGWQPIWSSKLTQRFIGKISTETVESLSFQGGSCYFVPVLPKAGMSGVLGRSLTQKPRSPDPSWLAQSPAGFGESVHAYRGRSVRPSGFTTHA